MKENLKVLEKEWGEKIEKRVEGRDRGEDKRIRGEGGEGRKGG